MEDKKRKYDRALVIFIDILGSQNRNDFEVLYKINDTFHTLLLNNKNNNKSYTIYIREVYTFSDCAYIIYDFKKDTPEEKKDLGRLFEVALANCEPLLIQFLNEGFVFRGGIAYGDVYYETDRNLLFGPGINTAYKLENAVAKYPRIAIDDFVAETILSHWNKVVYEMDHPKTDEEKLKYELFGNLKREQGCVVKRDFDGIYMLHYLNAIETNAVLMSYTHTTNEEFLYKLRRFCEDGMRQNASNLYIVQKYGWLLNYIDSVCE